MTTPPKPFADLVAHSQTEALGLLLRVPGSDMKCLGLSLGFDGVRPQPGARPPAPGEHTAAIFPHHES